MRNRINSSELSLFLQGGDSFYEATGEGEYLYFTPLVQDVSFVFNYGQNNVKVKSLGSSSYIAKQDMLSPEPELSFSTYFDPRLLIETGIFGLPYPPFPTGVDYVMALGAMNNGVVETVKSDLDSTFNAYFIVNKSEGFDFLDANPDSLDDIANLTGYTSIGFGNCSITSYDINMSADSLPTISVSARSANAVVENLNTGLITLPSINLTGGNSNSASSGIINGYSFQDRVNVGVVKGGGISPTVNINTNFPIAPHPLTGDICIQSANISLNLPRISRYGFGNKYTYGRDLILPADGSLSMDIIVTDFATGDFSNIVDRVNENSGFFFDGDPPNNDIDLDFKFVSSDDVTGYVKIFNGVIDNISYNNNINDQLTASIDVSFAIEDIGI